ncbi:MAG: hypothetical protein BWY96_00422 [Spirochaetes bacterium ADurb.BinA120]|nr:MAG: hypothetical protein BWY96_00422 [Spirochaetes bacterium ADurb.BinA120]
MRLRPVSLAVIVAAALKITASIALSADLSVLLTHNLEGRFSLEEKGQDENDPLLILAQNILAERRSGKADLFLDLGNAFYPGALSKYSFGSAVMDYFDYFGCDASLISSRDLRIGIDNLEFLQKGRKTRLLATGIALKGDRLFTPYIIHSRGGNAVAVVGIPSGKIRFDIAEKNLYGAEMTKGAADLEGIRAELETAGVRHVIALSGLAVGETMALMTGRPWISIAICGGDYTGELFAGKAGRVDLADGRSIVILNEKRRYYLLELSVGAGMEVRSFAGRLPAPIKTDDPAYREFSNRLTLWKRKFRDEEDRVIVDIGPEPVLTGDRGLACLARDRFNAEIGLVEHGTITPVSIGNGVRASDVLNMVGQDFYLFTFNLNGAELKKVCQSDGPFLVSGSDGKSVQGYPIVDSRMYRAVAPQALFERVEQIIAHELSYTNTWKNITDILMDDLKGDCAFLADDCRGLDDRFRATVDFHLSNFYDQALVKRGDDMDEPPGQPGETYRRWGLENRVDITVYNRLHQFILTPYMLYTVLHTRDDDEYYYQNNLLRGTFVYNLNLAEHIKPYHKSQCDTVVRVVNEHRPVLIRETAGANFTGEIVSAKLGLGFEKRVHDPVQIPAYGMEAVILARIPFLRYFSYGLTFDSFISLQGSDTGRRHIRSQIDNSLSVSVNRFLAFSLKHRWFYLYSRDYREEYRNSQVITSADLKTDFKIF